MTGDPHEYRSNRKTKDIYFEAPLRVQIPIFDVHGSPSMMTVSSLKVSHEHRLSNYESMKRTEVQS